MEVEAKTFEECLLFARGIGFQEIILKGNSLVVAICIVGKSPLPSSIASVVYGISSISHELCTFQVSHTRRNGDQLASLLTKHAQSVEHYIASIEENPYFLNILSQMM